jgi:hypothetical protein
LADACSSLGSSAAAGTHRSAAAVTARSARAKAAIAVVLSPVACRRRKEQEQVALRSVAKLAVYQYATASYMARCLASTGTRRGAEGEATNGFGECCLAAVSFSCQQRE